MHNQLEAYLAEVEARLRSVPKPRRDEELAEIRQHLVNALVVYQEQGETEDVAAAHALADFGPAEEAAATVAWAWRRFLRKHSVKTFCTIEGMQTAFAAFQIVFMSPRASDQRHWFYFWVASVVISAVFLILPNYLPSRSRFARPAPVRTNGD